MRLKKGYMLLAATTLVALLSCGKDNRDLISRQQTAIVNYLNSQRKNGEVIPYWRQGGVYVSIPNSDRAGRDALPVAELGDHVEFDFVGQVFSSRPEGWFYTNINAIFASDTLLTAEHWSVGPEVVTLGETPLIKGLQDGLPGSVQGDSVYLYLTSDQAYGGKNMGIVPKNSALMFFMYIQNVTKK